MKNVILSAFAMAFVFVACNSNSKKAKETKPAETTTIDTTAGTEKMNPVAEQLYACPMHPDVVGKKDEKCSTCGMKLTNPVKKAETP